MSRNKDMRFLFELLDDENEQSANMAMAELLTHERETENYLHEMPIAGSPRLRKRLRQLQQALHNRAKRRLFAEKLGASDVNLLSGLIRLHLGWFDNDKQELVEKQWKELRDDFRKFKPKNLAELAVFMKRRFPPDPANREFHPDSFCIGAALDSKLGSDLLFCAIASILSEEMPRKFDVVRCGMDAAVMDHRGNLLFPIDDWQIYSAAAEQEEPVLWPPSAILRYISAILFVAAASSDGFRYLYTIGAPLALSLGERDLSFLPYPYGSFHS